MQRQSLRRIEAVLDEVVQPLPRQEITDLDEAEERIRVVAEAEERIGPDSESEEKGDGEPGGEDGRCEMRRVGRSRCGLRHSVSGRRRVCRRCSFSGRCPGRCARHYPSTLGRPVVGGKW
jgi:hypothetical protein